jgi:ribulose-5-phosphate 4-epimerase/fuculose-1-phosphate aldolase
MAVAPDLSEAFDRIDILAKAARIYFLVKSSGQEPAGLSPSELTELKNYTSGS